MAYINHLKQMQKRPLTAAEVGGPEAGDIEMFNGEDPTAAFSHAFEDALGRNVEKYRRNPVPTRKNLDALEDARSEGFIDADPVASRPRRRAQEDKLAIAEASNIGKANVAGIGADARRYEADARRDGAGVNAGARVNSSRVQGLMRQLDTLRGERSGMSPGSPAVEGSGMRGFLGFGTPAKKEVPGDPRIPYVDSQVGALERQLQQEPQEFTLAEIEETAARNGIDTEEAIRRVEAAGHVVAR